MDTAGDIKISAYVICKNEADMIGDCLKSLAFCADIVVVDSGSTDGTLAVIEQAIADGMPVRLFQRDWPGYSAQKQFALDQCAHDWCLCLDADERAEEGLGDSLKAAASEGRYQAFGIGYRLYLHGYGYQPKSVRSDYPVRFAQKSRCRYDLSRKVHEGLIVDGETGRIPSPGFLHRRSLSIQEQMQKEIAYSRIKAEQVFAAKGKPRPLRLVFNPLVYFIRLFFFRRYFLCGFAGFIHAMTAATYSFMVEARIYQLWLESRHIENEGE